MTVVIIFERCHVATPFITSKKEASLVTVGTVMEGLLARIISGAPILLCQRRNEAATVVIAGKFSR
jgi:hypothetical protein